MAGGVERRGHRGGCALGVTLALVLVTNALAFSTISLIVARVVLFLALAVALGLALIIPLMRLNQSRAAKRAETAFPRVSGAAADLR